MTEQKTTEETDFAEYVQKKDAEIIAIGGALEVLRGTGAGGSGTNPVFLQVGSKMNSVSASFFTKEDATAATSTAARFSDEPFVSEFTTLKSSLLNLVNKLRASTTGLFKTQSGISEQTSKIRAALLQTTLSSNTNRSNLGSNQEPTYVKNAMTNVIRMINELVAKMQQQNRDDTRKQQQCDDQTKQADENLKVLQKSVNNLALKLQQMGAEKKDLIEEVADLKKQEV